MEQAALKKIFEETYDRKQWQLIARELFGADNLLAKPAKINLPSNQWDATGVELGNFETTDGRLVGIYELTIGLKAQLHRNRKGLRDLLNTVYKEVDAALVVFVQGNKWRFSYVSEIYKRNEAGKREKRTTDPKRYTYLLGEGERSKTAADRFAKIKTSANLFKAGVSLVALEEAFNVEKMSKEFFNAYRKHYGAFTAYLTGEDENSKETGKPAAAFTKVFKTEKKTARDFVKKLLGRIVFMYFLEKKGWLGVPKKGAWGEGDENFLSNLFRDAKHKSNFYSNVLVPLFYETLNTDRTDELFKIDKAEFSKGDYHLLKVPFLNGGLFENDLPEADLLVFPQQLFADLFNFFDQYNFTVYEDSPDEHTVAVDPEMLGHIFENLLEDNKDKGAFYTPKEIVHYMCQESLIEYLYTKLNPQQPTTYSELGKEQINLFGNKGKQGQLSIMQKHETPKENVKREAIEKLIKHQEAGDIIEHDETILKALREVKVCDPAIGSGAFPMGILMEIYHTVEALYLVSPDVSEKVWKMKAWDPAKVKSDIIQNSIYGVDIEKGAVDIARLRFWLSLVVDETKPQPLPNLDYKIVVGNSLLSKFDEEVIDIKWSITNAHATQLTKKIVTDQVVKLQILNSWQQAYFIQKGNKQKLQLDIRNLKIDILANQLSLSKMSYQENNPAIVPLTGFALTSKQIQTNLENKLVVAGHDNTIQKLLAIRSNKNAKLEFFDWKLDFPEVMNRMDKNDEGFDIVIGNPPYIPLELISLSLRELFRQKYKEVERKYDSSLLFILEGYNLLKWKGVLSYIAPITWQTGENFRKFRTFVIADFGIDLVVNLPFDIFNEAYVETAIYQFQKERLLSYGIYNFSKKDSLQMLAHLQLERISYDQLCPPDYKIIINSEANKQLGKFKNERFISLGSITKSTQGLAGSQFPEANKHTSYCLPFLKKGNVYNYYLDIQETYLTDLSEKKNLLQFYQPEEKILVRRIVNRQDRLSVGFTEESLIFKKDINPFIVVNTYYQTKFILTLLASKLISNLYINSSTIATKDDFRQTTLAELRALPIPITERLIQNKFVTKADLILNIKARNPSADTLKIEKEIDLMVYKLYLLTYSEACIIERNSDWMGKEEYEAFSLG